jgi:hypothetical protein
VIVRDHIPAPAVESRGRMPESLDEFIAEDNRTSDLHYGLVAQQQGGAFWAMRCGR